MLKDRPELPCWECGHRTTEAKCPNCGFDSSVQANSGWLIPPRFTPVLEEEMNRRPPPPIKIEDIRKLYRVMRDAEKQPRHIDMTEEELQKLERLADRIEAGELP